LAGRKECQNKSKGNKYPLISTSSSSIKTILYCSWKSEPSKELPHSASGFYLLQAIMYENDQDGRKYAEFIVFEIPFLKSFCAIFFFFRKKLFPKLDHSRWYQREQAHRGLQ